jgi:hypothetical protein
MSQVAETILTQLGGHRFLAVTSAKDLVRGDRHVMMSVMGRSTKQNVNRVRITLDQDGTYKIETFLVRGMTFRTLETRTGVSNLKEWFTSLTGLRTSFG